ncbi:tRNA (guanosine(18)-2'-O)-methyltransferase [Salvia divinorum]|uniref:tRNA (Guanosine(18)-2'-O)-methyltransferase n=1 Tax=Salvia divinorum TaxID=28513 RepID=A0ABD1IER5_SALDI
MSKRGRWADKEAQSFGVGRICNYNEVISTGWYRWEAFIFLYEMLEEYGTHLVEAAWNHQIMLLLSSLPSENTVCSANEELYHSRMVTAEQILEWLAILWERGFCHDNPLV